MSKLQRVGNVLSGIITIFCAILLVSYPEYGYPLIFLLLCISLIAYGVRSVIYYFTMARFMVGGKAMLYKGVVVLDLGLFTLSLSSVPQIYIILYLAAVHLFTGGVDILSAIDSKRSGSPAWKLKLAGGILSVLIALTCILFGRNQTLAVYIYCSGLIYSAIFKIISAFRKTAIVYIQ